VARWLREQGFAKAQSMAGGIEQWADEIEPGMAKY
jgi:rhodanese-related sulfurtransferase